MAFFNQKEEVIDVKLTQFGKKALARGFFKPVYYQFFDDDILYNSSNAGFQEHQNDTENRILKETPRLKTQHLTSGVHTRYMILDELIVEEVVPRYENIVQNVLPSIQERILLYPLGEQETATQSSPHFMVSSMDSPFTDAVQQSPLVQEGIVKDIPRLLIRPVYKIEVDRSSVGLENTMINEETFVDLASDEITFADNSKIKIKKENIVLDVGESNTFYEKNNFSLSIFHVQRSGDKESLVPIRYLKNINKLFHIKTDEDSLGGKYEEPSKRGHYGKGEQ